MTTTTPTEAPAPPRRVDVLVDLVADAEAEATVAEAVKSDLRAELLRSVAAVRELTGAKPTLRHEAATISYVEPAGSLRMTGTDEHLRWLAEQDPEAVEGTLDVTVVVPSDKLDAAREAVTEAVAAALRSLGVPSGGVVVPGRRPTKPVDFDGIEPLLDDDGRTLLAAYRTTDGAEVPGLAWSPPAAPRLQVRLTADAKARALSTALDRIKPTGGTA